jgi:hypothetical protein
MPGGGYCGASNCLILGFCQYTGGWRRVYAQFGGDGLEVLSTSTKGHRDLRQWEILGGGKSRESTSHWDGQAYGKPVARQLD